MPIHGLGGVNLGRIGCFVLITMVFTLFPVMAKPVGQEPGQVEPRPLPILTTAQDAHNMTVEQAAKSYPVHLRAVVTYYDPYNDPRHPAFFASDSTGGIYVELRSLPAVPLKSGVLVEIIGVSAAGGYAPIVIATEVHVFGTSAYPSIAHRANLGELLTGMQDGQWVEVEGVVHSVHKSQRNVSLNLALKDGDIVATTVRQPGAEYDDLVDAKIRIRGNVAPLFNRGGEMTGVYLVFPDRGLVVVEEPAPTDPFSLPVSRVSNLLRFTAQPPSRHRVHIRGIVTLAWPGRLVCVQDGLKTICAQTDQTNSLSPGDSVDMVGFATPGPYTPALNQAIYEAGDHKQQVAATAITAEQALSGDHDAQLVELEGQLIGQNDLASDPNIVLSSGNHVFLAVLPEQSGKSGLSPWIKGSKLRLTGICAVKPGTDTSGARSGGFPVPQSFQLLLRSPQDVVVIKRPSWWTPPRATAVLGTGVLLTLLILAWVYVLRKQVDEQTLTIRQQLSEQERNSNALAAQSEELSQQASELLRSQNVLEAQTLTLQAVLDSIDEGLVAANEKGEFFLWNPAAERILGLRSATLPLKEWSAHYGFYLPDTVTPTSSGETPLERAMRGEISTTEILLRKPESNGHVWLETNSSPLRGKDGSVHGGVLAFRDITGRKADEVEIRKLNDDLEERIDKRTAQLMVANQELDAFSYSVSHDLRGPLRHIEGFSSLLVKEMGQGIPADAGAYLQHIQAAVKRMGQMVDALLRLAKLGQKSLQLLHTELNPMVDEVISVLKADCQGRVVEWRVAQLPPLDCDPILLSQVFHNLLGNALKYSRYRTPAVIEVDSIQHPDKPVVIFVRDNGAGFNMKYADKLFGVFQRMHTDAEFEGTGVGLATVQRIIKKHGGTIWAEAKADQGATFYFTCGDSSSER